MLKWWLFAICGAAGTFAAAGYIYLRRVIKYRKYCQRVKYYQRKYYIQEMRCPRCFQVFPECLDRKVFHQGVLKCKNCQSTFKKPWLGGIKNVGEDYAYFMEGIG